MSRLSGRAVGQFPVIVMIATSVAVLSIGCQSKSSPASGFSAPMSGHSGVEKDSKKVSDGMRLMMDSINKPEAPLHFSFKANENVNPKFPMTNGELPRLGPVTVEAELSQDEVTVAENRDGKQSQSKGSKSDAAAIGLAKLGVLGCMLEVTFPFAFAGPTAEAAGSDVVGGMPTDKYNMDTTTANATTQAGLAMLGDMFNGKVKIKSVKGSAWLEKSTGRLVKFNLDADLSTRDGYNWQEHYEAMVTPK